jgi:VanZ family protein
MNIRKIDKKKLFWWIATIGLMVGIFLFSSQPATKSSSISGDIVEKIVKPLLQLMHITYSETFHTIVRKLAHFTFYGLLGISTFNLLRNYRVPRTVILSLLVCFFYACMDEFHQTFVPGRSGEFRDVCIDLSGSLFGILIDLYVISVIRKLKCKNLKSGKLSQY